MREEAFRQEVRAAIRALLPPDMAARNSAGAHHSREDLLAWTALLAQRGWSTPNWPAEYGGPGWTAAQRHIFEEEAVLAGAPALHIQSIFLAGPLIYTFGDAAQKARYLPPIRNGEELWAQGFSEPNAGSDLASLRTRAVRMGDEYVINGQKIWTSDADWCDQIFLLARTGEDEKPQRAISMFLFSLRTPGVTVRPIPLIDGSHALCEVFLDNVRIPATALLGEEGRGWTYAKFLLDNERTTTAEVPRNRRYLAKLHALANEARDGAGRLIDNPAFSARLARLELEFLALEAGARRAIAAPGDPNAAPLPSVLKIKGTELMQATQDMQAEALGGYGLILEDAAGVAPAAGAGIVEDFLFRRAATIYGGSSEIQRGIIAKVLQRGPRLTPAIDDDDERMLRDAARRHSARSGGAEEDARAQIAGFGALGWLGLGAPDAALSALGMRGAAAVLEETARAPSPTPLLGALHAAQLLARAAPGRPEFLDAAVSGEPVFAVAHEEAPARGRVDFVETRATPAPGGGFVLAGRKTLALNGAVAAQLLVSARIEGESGVSLFVTPADARGVRVLPYALLDGRPCADIVFEDAALGAGTLLARAPVAQEALAAAQDSAVLMACAEALGAMDEALWITRDYLATRTQFGQTLAQFQSLQHRLSDMYAELEMARAMLQRGLDAADSSERTQAAGACKARVGLAAAFVSGQAVQLHGGIAMTAEYVIGRYFKRLRTLGGLFGSPQFHLEAFHQALRKEAPARGAL